MNLTLYKLKCNYLILIKKKNFFPIFFQSPELVARLEKILAEQANKEYARMIGKVASSYDVETFKLLDTEEFQSVRSQLTAIINITFTVVAVFAAVYHVAQTITGDTGMVFI
jgi:hypothetical protein